MATAGGSDSGAKRRAVPQERLQGAVRRALAELGRTGPPTRESIDLVGEALDRLLQRGPGAEAGLDDRMLARLALVALDPDAQVWMERAGLLGSDSCGYPVEGGFYDVSSEVGSHPLVAATPQLKGQTMARLQQEWADSFILTGSADTDLPWRDYLEQAASS